MTQQWIPATTTSSRVQPTNFYEGDLAQRVTSRVYELQQINEETRTNKDKIRDIMDGGAKAVSRIVGKNVNEAEADQIAWANMMLMANTRMAQKLGRRPDIKVDPPDTSVSQPAHKSAEKRARIVESFDVESKMQLQLPQAGRWLPGYGFFVWTIEQGETMFGEPYPYASLRDPYYCYPGTWGIDQQPDDLAIKHVIPEGKLVRMFPEHESEILGPPGAPRTADSAGYLPRGQGGAVLLEGISTSSFSNQPMWQNQANDGLEVYEYINDNGIWWVLPDRGLLLDHTPNPLDSGPPFVVVKRFSFNKLQGAYEQLIGLMSAMARINWLSVQAAEDAVHAETNIIGDTATGTYNKGRRSINYLVQGSSVQKMNDRIPFEVFQQRDALERQIRNMASYPVTDNAESPMSFVTGLGLEELKGSVDLEVQEYQKLMRYGLQLCDIKRMEWADKVWPNQEVSMYGFEDESGAFAETYTPTTHIDGNYQTRRVYGVMSAWDETNKIIGGANLHQLGIIDKDTFRENIDGLDNHQKIKDRLRNEKLEAVLFEALSAGAANEDPRAIEVALDLLPQTDIKDAFEEYFLPDDEEDDQMQQMMEELMGGAGGGQGPGGVPNTQTVLNRLMSGQAPQQGIQSVGRVGG